MSDALFQHSFYIGNIFNGILYGVELALYVQTMYIYFTSDAVHKRSSRWFMSLSTVMLILITIYVAVESVFGEEMWVANANYPGGPAAWFATHVSVWYQTLGTASSVVLQLVTDGILIFRCLVLWQNERAIIFPCFLWLGTFVFGIVQLYFSGSPKKDFFVGLAAHFGVTYTATSIALNTVVTCLICGRLMYYAHCMQKDVGPGFAGIYFSTAAIVVESALPYTLCGIAFVVSYGLNSGISVLFLSLYAMFMCISPQMLILRVASGRAWDTETAVQNRSMQFQRMTLPAMATVTEKEDSLQADSK